MTDKLPPKLLALFTPRPPLKFISAHDHAAGDRKTATISGVGQYLSALKDFAKTDVYNPTESWLQERDRKRSEKREALEKQYKEFESFRDSPAVPGLSDPMKTLFVSRLDYDVEPQDLQREFRRFGPIEKIDIITNKHAPPDAPKREKHKGYAFVVFEHPSDMEDAKERSNGVLIRSRRILTDVMKCRTVENWLPRRFGGCQEGSRGHPKAPRPTGSTPYDGPASAGPGAGFRGGFNRGPPRGRGFRGVFDGGFRGGDRGSRGGGRGGIGYQNGFSAAAPDGAPSGPRGPRRYDDDKYNNSNGRGSGSNREPVGPRQRGSDNYRDRDREPRDSRDDQYRKRPHGDTYEDPRQKRRYY